MLCFVRRLRSCVVVPAAFVVASLAVGQAPKITKDVPYTTDRTGAYRADLYQPTGPQAHIGIVMIHGGSWRSGRKQELRKLSTVLARDGYTCFSIDYDTHRHSFPISWQESRAAVAFLRTHAAAYSIDPDRIVVLGTSAGGQLAALLALAPQGPTTALPVDPGNTAVASSTVAGSGSASPLPPSPVPVAAAVLFNGGYDLHPRHWLLRRYLGGDCDEIPDVCNDASPDFHVHSGAPPIFVGHGTHDHLIPYAQATTFLGLLQAAHDPVTPFAATGAGHSYWRNRHWFARNLKAAEAFLTDALPPL